MESKCSLKVNLNNIYHFLIRREWIKEVEWRLFVEYPDFILELRVVFAWVRTKSDDQQRSGGVRVSLLLRVIYRS